MNAAVNVHTSARGWFETLWLLKSTSDRTGIQVTSGHFSQSFLETGQTPPMVMVGNTYALQRFQGDLSHLSHQSLM